MGITILSKKALPLLLALSASLSCWGDKPFPLTPDEPIKKEEPYNGSFYKPKEKEEVIQEKHIFGVVNGINDIRSSLEEAIIQIYDSQGNLARQDTSGADGNFRSELTSKGLYKIIVSHPDYNAKLYPDQVSLEDSIGFNPILLHSSIDQNFFYNLKKGGESNNPLTMWDLSRGYADPSVALINPTDSDFRDIVVDILKNYIPKASGDKLKPKEPYVVYDPYLIPNTSTDTVKANVKIYWRPAESMNGMAAGASAHVQGNVIYGANIYIADNLSSSQRRSVLLEIITKALFDIPNTSDDYRLFSSDRNDYSAEGLKILKAITMLDAGW